MMSVKYDADWKLKLEKINYFYSFPKNVSNIIQFLNSNALLPDNYAYQDTQNL